MCECSANNENIPLYSVCAAIEADRSDWKIWEMRKIYGIDDCE